MNKLENQKSNGTWFSSISTWLMWPKTPCLTFSLVRLYLQPLLYSLLQCWLMESTVARRRSCYPGWSVTSSVWCWWAWPWPDYSSCFAWRLLAVLWVDFSSFWSVLLWWLCLSTSGWWSGPSIWTSRRVPGIGVLLMRLSAKPKRMEITLNFECTQIQRISPFRTAYNLLWFFVRIYLWIEI